MRSDSERPGQRVVACPRSKTESVETALAVWLNSSLGPPDHSRRPHQYTGQLGSALKKADLQELPVLDDLRALSRQPSFKTSANLFDQMSDAEFQRLPAMHHCPARRALDDALAQILNLPNLTTLAPPPSHRTHDFQPPPLTLHPLPPPFRLYIAPLVNCLSPCHRPPRPPRIHPRSPRRRPPPMVRRTHSPRRQIHPAARVASKRTFCCGGPSWPSPGVVHNGALTEPFVDWLLYVLLPCTL